MKSQDEIKTLLKYLARQPGLSHREEGWEAALSWVLGDDVATPIEDDIAKSGEGNRG